MPAIPLSRLRRFAARNRDELLLGLALGVKGLVMLGAAAGADAAPAVEARRVAVAVAERHPVEARLAMAHRGDAALSSEIEAMLDDAMFQASAAARTADEEEVARLAAARAEVARAKAELARAKARRAAHEVRVTREKHGRVEIVKIVPKQVVAPSVASYGGGDDVLEAAIDHGLERAFPLPPVRNRAPGHPTLTAEPPCDA